MPGPESAIDPAACREWIRQELAAVRRLAPRRVALVSTSAGKTPPFSVLPRRSALGIVAAGFLVGTAEAAALCLTELDGEIETILVDVEPKTAVDLPALSASILRRSRMVPVKPNDATVEATMLFLGHELEQAICGRKVIIVGSGNIASKLALRLAESGASVTVWGRNAHKARQIVQGLNMLLPRFAASPIAAIAHPAEAPTEADALVAFVSAPYVAGEEWLKHLRGGGVVLDGGINNLAPAFIAGGHEMHLRMQRIDVRCAFSYLLLPLLQDTEEFFQRTRGRGDLAGHSIVAGGVIGIRGDVVVDRIAQPTQVIGIANGTGGLRMQSEWTDSERVTITNLSNHLSDAGLRRP